MDYAVLAQRIEDADIGLRATGMEKNLFVIHMPAQTREGALLRESSPGTIVDAELPRFYRTSFQLVVRHGDYLKGRKMAEDVSAVLDVQEVAMTGMYVHFIRARHLPFVFPASQGDLLEFSVNFDACYVKAV